MIYNIITIESINSLDIKSISFAVITPDVLPQLSKYHWNIIISLKVIDYLKVLYTRSGC